MRPARVRSALVVSIAGDTAAAWGNCEHCRHRRRRVHGDFHTAAVPVLYVLGCRRVVATRECESIAPPPMRRRQQTSHPARPPEQSSPVERRTVRTTGG
ncbi:unnamed protein product [Macrosiphum euphorbiae]|uniref:Secreted protein n=1 Tax=Macrosiphum euphorbiae TaxID=13131 RepID=A0AAV0WJ63_9HEMI|nr:unnamed protein product [Macrosiphum euphorbiae]